MSNSKQEMARFQTEDGHATNEHDGSRAMWYGNCGYWTDDWTKLKLAGSSGIPSRSGSPP